jgi:peroxiredoxin
MPQVASTSAESVALSKDLKNVGWKFVGPTTVYAFMRTMGLVNDYPGHRVIAAGVTYGHGFQTTSCAQIFNGVDLMDLQRRFIEGDMVSPRELRTIYEDSVLIPDRAKLVHVQFRRWASCPICNLHLRSFTLRAQEIRSAGIVEIVVFESTAESLRAHDAKSLPFALLADPERKLYSEFGLARGMRAMLDPRAWGAAIKGIRSFGLPSSLKQFFNLPADFLITPDGKIVACKYGIHADDQWDVNDLLWLADHGTR